MASARTNAVAVARNQGSRADEEQEPTDQEPPDAGFRGQCPRRDQRRDEQTRGHDIWRQAATRAGTNGLKSSPAEWSAVSAVSAATPGRAPPRH